MRGQANPPDCPPPEYLDCEMWTGPAPMRPYNPMVHPRGWRSFKEYGNGILGDMCIHMLDMVRWMLGLGWPKRIASTGGILVQKDSKANVPDTQTATFDFGDLDVVWEHRTWGQEPDPKYPWGATIYGDKGTLKLSVYSYDFIPFGGGTPIHKDVTYEFEQYPEDKTEKDLERHVAPAIRRHMIDFLGAIGSRGKPVADIEEGHISTASCILANLALQLGRTLTWDRREGRGEGRRRGEQALAPAVPRALGPSGQRLTSSTIAEASAYRRDPGCLHGSAASALHEHRPHFPRATMKLTRYRGNPILSPHPEHPWEDLAVFNPAAWYDERDEASPAPLPVGRVASGVQVLLRAGDQPRRLPLRAGLGSAGARPERRGLRRRDDPGSPDHQDRRMVLRHLRLPPLPVRPVLGSRAAETRT